uniref:S1 RNA-binding domain-containing protein n=1 Tax=Enterovirga sp. TaxID=2026350 RepID=UPI002CBFF83B
LGEHAPRIEVMQIPTDKIRDVIGTGGKVIREIVEKTGAKINVEDDGTIKIASSDGKQITAARNWIRSIVAEPEAGTIYDGTVVKTMEFGAFVNFFGPKDGLVHISELAPQRVAKVTDVVKEGDKVKVKFLGQDDRGKIKLSMKVVDQQTGEDITEKLRALRDADRAEREARGEVVEDREERGERRRDRDRGSRDRGPRRDRDRDFRERDFREERPRQQSDEPADAGE